MSKRTLPQKGLDGYSDYLDKVSLCFISFINCFAPSIAYSERIVKKKGFKANNIYRVPPGSRSISCPFEVSYT
eukprot:4630024-Amphidinium_carterae.1